MKISTIKLLLNIFRTQQILYCNHDCDVQWDFEIEKVDLIYS